ncbi:iron chelate uptake ABC transporter family permease subunit [Microbacterium sp. UBA3486]|uniref:FecCD family ABC transporter permease n=1 Tax=Microbacterium TaxID=33882 RepID=UPI0025CE5CB8|nr:MULTISPECIES: iron ABC transporter permease [Microbacterium]
MSGAGVMGLTAGALPDRDVTSEGTVVTSLRDARRRARIRLTAVFASLVAVGLAAFSIEILIGGSAELSPDAVFEALFGEGTVVSRLVVWESRLPRALTAVLVGALFGMAGVVYQRLIGNVLATPDIIGVSSGASAGAVAVLVGLGGTGIAVQGGAIVGAVFAVLVIFGLSWKRESSTYRLVLVGIGVGACFAAVTSYLLTFADSMTSTRAMRWMIGSLAGTQWSDVALLFAALALGVVAVAVIDPSLDAIRLGDPLARGLGTRVGFIRVAALLLGALLAALATSVVGPIAFLALVSGPIAARLVRQGGPFPAALVGAALLLLADVVAQSAPFVSPVPTGVVTGLIGAPVLIFLLLTRKADA